MKGYLVLENGEVFEGERIGYEKDCICEVVFNTSMAGYLEVFTDPSYCGQGMCMTYPLIGNYGSISEDYESNKIWMEAIFIHELAPVASNFRSEESLEQFLIASKVPGLTHINTRKLTKVLREKGTMKGKLTSDISNITQIQKEIEEYKFEKLVEKVGSKEIETIGEGDIHIALMNYGAKNNISRCLVKRGCKVSVFPSTYENIKPEEFDGILLSNGPGDPADCSKEIEIIQKLYASSTPIFGICLGHQLMALATGAKTGKLKYGHRGPNQPAKDLRKDRVFITSQNHGYYVLEDSIDPNVAEVSHININDQTIEGLKYKNKDILTVQFHPEACPGPQDSEYLFDEFIEIVKRKKEEKKHA